MAMEYGISKGKHHADPEDMVSGNTGPYYPQDLVPGTHEQLKNMAYVHRERFGNTHAYNAIHAYLSGHLHHEELNDHLGSTVVEDKK